MQRLDLLRAALKCSFRVAAAIIELDYLFKRRRLTAAEVRRGFGHLAQALGAPQAGRNLAPAEVAIAFGFGVVAERAIDVEVAAGGCGIADQRLVGRASGLRRVGMRRAASID